MDDFPVLRYPKPRPRKVGKSANPITIVGSDTHFPLHDDDALDIFLQVVKDANPVKVILNGDIPDLLAVSRYPKDIRESWDLNAERKAMHDFLHRLVEAAPNASIVEVDGNHSGDGTESRWWRYLSERLGELASLPDVIEGLSYKRVWHPEWAWDIPVVPHETITHGLVAIHGDVARSHAAYSAKAMLEKWRVNLIMGHVHRMGYYGYRVPEIGGQQEHQMRAYEGGCLCRLDPPYLQVANWQQGFTIVRHDDDAGSFGVEQVLIHKGVATSTTMGGTYRAG